jgi:hypothetical protein
VPGLGSAGVVVVDDFERANLGGWLFVWWNDTIASPGLPLSRTTEPAPHVIQVEP